MSSKKKLVIVESPAKSKTIEKFLGSDYRVLASMGHIRDLPSYRMGINIKDNFSPQYELSKDKKKIIDELIKEAKKTSCIYLAPDPDREGEAIAWHLYEILKEHCPEFVRVQFNEITKNAVLNAFKLNGKIDFNRVNAQQARRLLDRLVGYRISPLLQGQKSGAKSAGRVQTVALRLIVQREREIRKFSPQEYWSLKANLLDFDCELQLAKIDKEKVDIPNKEKMDIILDALSNQKLVFAQSKVTSKKRNPYPPFITSTLQQEASSSLGMNPSQTMRVAQQLYEGIQTEEGTVGLITYMRTDSVNLSNDVIKMIRSFVQENYGDNYLPKTAKKFKSKEGAHEAIRPTSIVRTPDYMSKFLDDKQLKLYSLIWRRAVASQMSPARFEQKSIELFNEKNQKYLFKATVSKLVFPGFLIVYKGEESKKEKELPDLQKGQLYSIKKLLPEQHFTEPPPRFSEATLVKELEAHNIGRPSTYASIVRVIQDRDYVDKIKGRLKPSVKGEEVCDYLINRFNTLFAVEFTAEMEKELDQIEVGNIDWSSMLSNFYSNLEKWILEVKKENAVDNDKVLLLINSLLQADIKWEEPQKHGKRVFDEKTFVNSLLEQSQKENNIFSQKQWDILVRIFARYASSFDSQEIIEKAQIEETLNREEESSINSKLDQKRVGLLDGVKFDEPIKKGKRVYDDGKFYTSLKQQVNNGKSLSDKQLKVLMTFLEKYKLQIDSYDEKVELLELDIKVNIDEERYANLKKLMSLFDEIKVWKEPVKKGKKVFDDCTFIESLRQQLKARYNLSDKQVMLAKKTLKKYIDVVPHQNKIISSLGI